MKPNRIKKGAALIFVLVLTAVMATLMSAFIVINRHQIALSANTLARESAYDACLSGLNYVQSRIEADQTWGAKSFPAGNTTVPYPAGFSVTVFGDGLPPAKTPPSPAANYIKGTISTPTGIVSDFKASVINNLQIGTPLPGTALGDVPARSIRIRIDAQSGGVKRRLDVVFRKHAFTDSVIASGLDLVVDPNTVDWVASSRDFSNLARANGNVTIPKPTLGNFNFNGRKGEIKAGSEIYLDTSAVSKALPTVVQTEETAANGRFRTSSRPVVIPDLTLSQMRLPAANIVIPPGNYSMTECQKEMAGGTFDSATNLWTVNIVAQRAIQTPANLVAGTTQMTFQVQQASPGSGMWLPPGQPITTGSGPDSVKLFTATVNGVQKDVVADLTKGNIYVPPGVTLSTTGDINFLGNNVQTGQTKTGNPVFAAVNTNLSFGVEYSASGLNTPYSLFNKDDVLNQMESAGAALVAVKGSIGIGGVASGLGSISGDGDVKFSAQPGMLSVPSAAVAVRAGQDLTLNPPPKTASAALGLKCDGPIFNSSMNATNKWSSFDNWIEQKPANLSNSTTFLANLTAQNVTDGTAKVLKGSDVWDVLAKFTGQTVGSPDATFKAQPYYGSAFSLEKYVRAREYMRTGDVNWLDITTTNATYDTAAIRKKIDDQVYGYSNFAQQSQMTMQQLMANGAVIPDMFFVGLVYAGKNVLFNGGLNSLYTEGAVVAKGGINITAVKDFLTVYNHDYLEDITRGVGAQTKLDVTYFNLQ